jgi:hypothetical protein
MADKIELILQDLIRSHNRQVSIVELTVESIPRDSRYSPQLTELTRREELDPLNPELGMRVDELLELGSMNIIFHLHAFFFEKNNMLTILLIIETRRFYSKSANQNIKRWKSLDQKLSREREKVITEMCSKLIKRPDSHSSSSSQRRVTSADLDMEALRLENYYNENWFDIEVFHLNEAFSSQKSRVDAEWGI